MARSKTTYTMTVTSTKTSTHTVTATSFAAAARVARREAAALVGRKRLPSGAMVRCLSKTPA